MKLKTVTTEAKLLLIGIPVFLWTMIPIYHLFLFAISPRDSASGLPVSVDMRRAMSSTRARIRSAALRSTLLRSHGEVLRQV